MHLRIVAWYPADVPQLHGRPGVFFRRGRDGTQTGVPCELVAVQGRTFAHPSHDVPAGTGAPFFAFRALIVRRELAKAGVGIVVQPDDRKAGLDPEQRILAPRYSGEQRLYYEFQRGEILFLTPKGDVEVRLVVVDAETGEVGTKTLGHLHTRYLGLVGRCQAELQGRGQLFPPPSRAAAARRASVPSGTVNLSFGSVAGASLLEPFEDEEQLDDARGQADAERPATTPFAPLLQEGGTP